MDDIAETPRNIAVIEQDHLPARVPLKDPEVRNGLNSPKLNTGTELQAVSGTTWKEITGSPVENKALFTLLLSLQSSLGFVPLRPANNLSELTNAAIARLNLGLISGGDGDIWILKGGFLLGAGMRQQIVEIAAAYTIAEHDYSVFGDATAGNIAVNLPAAAGNKGRIIVIKKVDASGNSVVATPNGADTIDGAASFSLATQYNKVTLQAYSAGWYII